MKRILPILALAFLVNLVPVQAAEAGSVQVDRWSEEVRETKTRLRDDEKDLRQIARFVVGWHKAWEAGKHKQEVRWDRKLGKWLNAEREENTLDVADAEEDLQTTGGPRQRQSESQDLALERKRRTRIRDIRRDLKEVHAKFSPEHVAKRPAHEKKGQLLKALYKAAKRDVVLRTEQLAEAEAQLARAKANS